MKKIAIIGGALVVVVVIGVVVLLSNLDSIIKTAVEEVGSEATQAKVTLSEVEISADEGKAALRGFSVGNPAGFETPSAFKLGEVAVTLDLGTVTEDIVHIKEILIAGPEVTYEWKSDGSNLEVLQRNVEKFAGIGSGDSKSSGGKSSSSSDDEGGKKLIIDRIILRDGKVSVSANAAFLKGKKLDAPLPKIELKDIGKEEGGASAGDVIAKIMDAVTGAAGKAVGSLGIGELTKSLGGLTSGATDAVQKGVSGATDSIKQGTEGATGTLKKLFGN